MSSADSAMTESDFDARVAKLQQKILLEVGEPVPDAIKEAASKASGLERKPSVLRGHFHSQPHTHRLRVDSKLRKRVVVLKSVSDVLGLDSAKVAKPEVVQQGNAVVIRFTDPGTAKDVADDFKENLSKVAELTSDSIEPNVVVKNLAFRGWKPYKKV